MAQSPKTRTFRFGARRIEVTAASLAALPGRVDVVVSADDNLLSHSGGVSAAIWHKAGSGLERHVREAAPTLALGDLFVTPAFKLKAGHLIHAVTVDLAEVRMCRSADIADLVRRIVDRAAALGRSIALPLLATGAAGADPREVAHATVGALQAWLDLPTPLERVVLASPDHVDLIRVEVERLSEGFVPLEDLLAKVDSEWLAAWNEAGRAQDPSWLALLLDQMLPRLANGVARQLREDRRSGRVQPTQAERAAAALREAVRLIGQSTTSAGRTSSRDLIDRIDQALHLYGKDGEQRHLRSKLGEALRTRNAMVHVTTSGAGAREWDSLLAGVRAVATFCAATPTDDARGSEAGALHEVAADAVAGTSTLAGEWLMTGAARVWERARPLLRTVSATQQAGATPSPTTRRPHMPNTPVRELHQIMEDHLDEERLRELDAQLERTGHGGRPELRRLEHWLLVSDPVEALREEFGPVALRKLLADRTGRPPDPDATPADLARALARALGFPVPADPIGIQSARLDVEGAHTQVQLAGPLEIQGAVNLAAQHLERICQIVIHFVCRVAFKRDADTFFRTVGALEADETIRRASLGRLSELVERLQQELLVSTEPGVLQFEQDFGTRKILNAPGTGLARLRNAVVHHQSLEKPTGERQRIAREFVAEVRRLVEEVARADPRIFPRVVVVEEVRYDRWGRRLVRVRSDEGAEETLFTDESLQPGQQYLMHPLNNPVRVDPILVPLGDLLSGRRR